MEAGESVRAEQLTRAEARGFARGIAAASKVIEQAQLDAANRGHGDVAYWMAAVLHTVREISGKEGR